MRETKEEEITSEDRVKPSRTKLEELVMNFAPHTSMPMNIYLIQSFISLRRNCTVGHQRLLIVTVTYIYARVSHYRYMM